MQKIDLIKNEIISLGNDFIGFSFNLQGIVDVTLNFLLVVLLFFVMYFNGSVVERLFFPKIINNVLSYFIRFALGYILVATGIFMLGLLNILSPVAIYIVMGTFLLIGFLEFFYEKKNYKVPVVSRNFDPLRILAIALLALYFLRLLPPPVNGDGIDYHISFPRVYLFETTMMIPPLGDESYTTVPHLPEMLYIFSEVASGGEMSRIIHFGFFLLVFLLLYNFNPVTTMKDRAGPIAALLFASAPLVLHISTSSFSDFPALLCLMLSGYILTSGKMSRKIIVLSAILMGGALASKVWVFVVFPVYFLFIAIVTKKSNQSLATNLVLYFFVSFSVPFLWLLRSFLLTGNIFYINENLGRNDARLSLSKYIFQAFGADFLKNRFGPTSDFGYLYIIGLAFFFSGYSAIKKYIKKNYILLVILLVIAAFILPFSFASGRYSLPYYIPIFTVSSVGFYIYFKKRLIRLLFLSLIAITVCYYSMNTFLQLPYAFGWSDQNEYIKRSLRRDPVAYYDFNGKFSQFFSKQKEVATYGMRIFAYAPFIHRNIYYFIDQATMHLDIPDGIDLLVVRGGDYSWMCGKEKIKNCSQYAIIELANDSDAKQYLYRIQKK